MKYLLKGCQYDRHASLVFEGDYRKYLSLDPYRNCKLSVSSKVVSGLIDSTGIVWIWEVIRSFYSHLLGKKALDRDVI